MLLVHLDVPSPRARFIARHLFERMLGWPVAFAASREEFLSASGARIHYGAEAIEGTFHVSTSHWLDKRSSTLPNELTRGEGAQLLLFPVAERFDLFAACFYLLALIEEQTATARDAHDRVPASALLLVRKNAHHVPLVDLWVLQLAADLRERFPVLPLPLRTYRHVLTVDVDNGLRFAARSWSRAMGASAKDLLKGMQASVQQRWRVRAGEEDDPYLTFVERLADAQGRVDRTIAFILTQGEGRFDHAARIEHPVFRSLLKKLIPVAEIALHPSYESSRSETLFTRERDRLSAVVGNPLRTSRQHFLRWKLPETFRALIALGFTEDHSIGFSDRSGFRAGTCTPFPWYDLELEAETDLMLHPFATMDSALANRSGEKLHAALGELKRVSDSVRVVKGTFISVWHDRFLSGHAEFKHGPEAMLELVEHARP
jgi:hypothetical protein